MRHILFTRKGSRQGYEIGVNSQKEVFEEQAFQFVAGVYDDELIADAYFTASRWSQLETRRRGIRDANDVIYQDDDSQKRRQRFKRNGSHSYSQSKVFLL